MVGRRGRVDKVILGAMEDQNAERVRVVMDRAEALANHTAVLLDELEEHGRPAPGTAKLVRIWVRNTLQALREVRHLR